MLISLTIILLPAILVFLVFETIELIVLSWKSNLLGNRVPSILLQARDIGWWRFGLIRAVLRNRRRLSAAEDEWHYRILYVRLTLIALSFVVSGLILALTSGQYDDFSRAGALSSLTGLYATIEGLRHEADFARSIEAIGEPVLSEVVMRAERGRGPQHLATMVMFLITIGGTLIWAYGDVFLLKVVGHESSKPIVPAPIENKLQPTSNVLIVSLSDGGFQRFVSIIESAIHGVQSLPNSPPISAPDLRRIEESLLKMETDLHTIGTGTTNITTPDFKQHDSSPSSLVRSYPVDFNSGVVLADAAPHVIEQAAQDAMDKRNILCNGYTDPSGDLLLNIKLSIQRASKVAIELIRRGVPPDKITIHGYGPQEAKGRRVEIVLQ